MIHCIIRIHYLYIYNILRSLPFFFALLLSGREYRCHKPSSKNMKASEAHFLFTLHSPSHRLTLLDSLCLSHLWLLCTLHVPPCFLATPPRPIGLYKFASLPRVSHRSLYRIPSYLSQGSASIDPLLFLNSPRFPSDLLNNPTNNFISRPTEKPISPFSNTTLLLHFLLFLSNFLRPDNFTKLLWFSHQINFSCFLSCLFVPIPYHIPFAGSYDPFRGCSRPCGRCRPLGSLQLHRWCSRWVQGYDRLELLRVDRYGRWLPSRVR